MTFTTLIQQNYFRSRQRILFAAYISLVISALLAPLTISGTNIAITVASGLCIISGEFFSKFKLIKANPITFSIILLLLLVIAAMFWSVASWSDRLIAFHKYQKLLYFIFLLPLCTEQRWCERAINAFLLAVVFTVLVSILVAHTGWHIGKTDSVQFIFHSRIETSYFVAFSTYVFVWRALHSQRYRWLCWILALILTYHEFFINNGRTGWVVYFGLVILFFIQCSLKPLTSETPKIRYLVVALRSMFLGIITILVATLVLYNASTSFHNRIGKLVHDLTHPHSPEALAAEQVSTKTQTEQRPDLRISFFKYALDLTKEHPIMGMGTASFQAVYKKSPTVAGWDSLNNPHNEYLLILVQGGLVGLCALLYFFYTQWRVSFQLRQNRNIAQALILSGLISCFFNAFLYTTTTGHFYVLFMSLLLAHYYPKPTSAYRRRKMIK